MEWFLLKLRILACMNKIWREPCANPIIVKKGKLSFLSRNK
jgi:hypothetical protein